jgi:hypothetical protein
VREMQGACDHLQHQLSIALNDRNLLLEQLRTLAGAEFVFQAATCVVGRCMCCCQH